MNLLLDTHVLLWWLSDNPKLSATARSAIAQTSSTVYVSAASAWEIGIKHALGKLDCPKDLPSQLLHHRFRELPITIAHALAAGTLPLHHQDPFDRLLVAQARAEDLVLVTRDPWCSVYGIATLQA